MKDNGKWHDEMRVEAFKNPEFVVEYENFKLQFEIIEQLKKIRKEQHMTLVDVATKMGTSKTALSRFESAQNNTVPKLSTIEKYVHAIGCSIEFKITPKSRKKVKNSSVVGLV